MIKTERDMLPQMIEIDDLDAEELRIYACTSEVQLLRYFEPAPGLFIAESPRVVERALDAGYEPISILAERKLVSEAVGVEHGQEKFRFPALAGGGITGETAGTKQDQSDVDANAETERKLVSEAAGAAHEQGKHADFVPVKHEPCEIVRQISRILERCDDIPVYVADTAVLTRITGYHLTQGFLCAMRRRELPTAEQVCSGAARIAVLKDIVNPAQIAVLEDVVTPTRIAVLEDVVNPTNVGAIFRSAAALGFDAVLLTRACCDPLYRRAIRVSMGTVFQMPWAYLDSPAPGYVQTLKRMGFATAAMALREDTVSIDDPRFAAEERLAVILGTEGDGLRAETIEACNYTVKIPMAHGVDSLNVAAASAIAFWELRRH